MSIANHPTNSLRMLIVADSKIPHAQEAFNQFGQVKVVPTKQMTHETIRDADSILVRSETRIGASLLKGTAVRFVGTATIGTDHVDSEYLKQNKIGFASCPGSNANSVAEYVLAALLELGAQLGIVLKGKTIGVVGHGNTGSKVAEKARAIGMNVLLNDPPLAQATHDSRYVRLDALMDADFISLHVPLTRSGEDATFHLFDQRRLSAMKTGSILINSSRGAVVETEALKNVLRDKHLRACVLDVWENEPRIDVELLQLVTLGTPHIAGYSHDGKLNATKMLQQAMSEYFQQPLLQQNDFDVFERKRIALPTKNENLEVRLRCAVKECYNIARDDAHLRQIAALEDNLRPEYFRELRANYPERREFHNYLIDAGAMNEQSKETLARIGFIVSDSRNPV